MKYLASAFIFFFWTLCISVVAKSDGKPAAFLNYQQNIRMQLNDLNFASLQVEKAEIILSDLRRNRWENVTFSESRLINSKLNETTAQELKFEGSLLKNVDLSGFKCLRCVISNTQFEGSRLDGASFVGSHFKNVVFKNSNLKRVHFLFSTFENCKMDRVSAQALSPKDIRRWNINIQDRL